MLKNYFRTAIRSLLKHKVYSLIKIGGLAIGLGAALIIVLFVMEDLSYDTMHTNYDRIMRIVTIDNAQGVESKQVGVSQPALGPALKAELPEVVKIARINNLGKIPLKYGDKLLKAEGAFNAESEFFEVFDFKITEGKKRGALDEPNSIVVTESLAKRLFGDEEAIGETVFYNEVPLNITAIMVDPPPNSHLQFDLLRSLTPSEDQPNLQQYLDSWDGISMYNYILLDQPTDPALLNPKLKAIAQKNEAFEFFTPTVQTLSDVHVNSKNVLFESNSNKADIVNLYVLATVAFLIIILAAVNFMNLVTAKSTGRAKEVGLRKVVGAEKSQLILQHLFEAVIITIISAFMALAIVSLILPFLNRIYQRSADIEMIFNPVSLLIGTLLILSIGLFAGLYPAFILSSFKPITVLKGAFKSSPGGIRLRRALVVIQFTISIALIIGTIIVFQQMNYINSKDLGYNREQIITIPLNGQSVISKARILRNELTRNPDIRFASTSSVQMGQQLGRTRIFPAGESEDVNFITSIMIADEEYIPSMEMKIIEGRNFSLKYPGDSLDAMIVNEALINMLDWEEAEGKTIRLQTGPDQFSSYNVIGVLKNFHFATIRHKVEPMIMLYGRNNNVLTLKIDTKDLSKTSAFIEDTWTRINPDSPYEYSFLDDQFANLYKSEKAFASMFTHFTMLALFIATLGLFALSAFTADQKRKEIGIRKILGANTSSIVFSLSFDFLKLVIVAFIIASPLAFYMMQNWLRDFSYSVEIDFFVFFAAGMMSIVIAWLTVSFQAYKAASANPIEALESE